MQGVAQYNTLEGNGVEKKGAIKGFLTFTNSKSIGVVEGAEKIDVADIRGTYEIGIPVLTTEGVIEIKQEITI